MSKSRETFSKKEKEKKKLKKKQQKVEKRAERQEAKAERGSVSLDEMLVYVDEFGNFTDTPPDETKPKKKIDPNDIHVSTPAGSAAGQREQRTGRVNYFNPMKGYGFIVDQLTSEKYFFHVNDCVEEVTANDLVYYDTAKTPRGVSAVGVSLVSSKK
ncbi:MAG: cold shock domain-containing protein [Nitritalea sp.]